MLRNANYIYDKVIIADDVNTTKEYCKKAQVGVDLSIRNVYTLKTKGCVLKSRSIASTLSSPLPPEVYSCPEQGVDEVIGWNLPRGTYIIDLNEGCSFGPRDTGYIIMRSSLNRSGVTINSAVWDPGYTSRNADEDKIYPMSIRMTVEDPLGVFIEKNARVAQLIIFENEDTVLYNGQWQGGLRVAREVK